MDAIRLSEYCRAYQMYMWNARDYHHQHIKSLCSMSCWSDKMFLTSTSLRGGNSGNESNSHGGETIKVDSYAVVTAKCIIPLYVCVCLVFLRPINGDGVYMCSNCNLV